MPARPTILLVETDEGLAASLRFTLELQGYNVELVSPDQLIDYYPEQGSPTCIILGERARGHAMVELAAKLVAERALWPIIVLTTNPRRATIDLARDCGVTLIEKPLLGETLDDALRRAFDRARQRSV